MSNAFMARPLMKIGVFLLLVGFTSALLLASCSPPVELERPHHPLPRDVAITQSQSGHYGGIFVRSESQEPKTFNPLVSEDAYSSRAIDLLLAALTRYDYMTDEIIPGLAKSWEISQDHKTYTFHLRRGVRWSDGAPFSADDVIFTFDAVFSPRYPNRYAQQFTIAGQPLTYEKVDSHTVRFTTADVYAPFLNDIGFIKILPQHRLQTAFSDGTLQKQWTSQTALHTPEAMVGTGPFRIFSYRPGERLVLAPNPHYWRADQQGQRLPYMDFLITTFVPNRNTETVLFATGQTDAVDEISVTDVAWVTEAAATYDFSLYDRGPDSSISFIWFNLHPGQDAKGTPHVSPHKRGWFENPKFRHAIAYGINRPGLIQAVYFGRARPLNTVISPANRKWHNPNTRTYPYAPAKAKALLEALGFHKSADGWLQDPQGRRVEFELLAGEGSDTAREIATTFIENMRALGIKVTLRMLDFGTMVSKVSDSFDYEAAMMRFTGGGDPSGGKAIYRSDGRLHVWYPQQPVPATRWEARVDALMDAQERTLDEPTRIDLIHQMQTIFSEKLPLIFLVTPNAYAGMQNRWQNIQVPPLGPIIWNIDELWLEDSAS